MLMFRGTLIGWMVSVTAMLWTLAAPACNVPVFRYALERWEADPYDVVVFHRGPLTSEEQALVEMMEQRSGDRLTNLLLTQADLAGEIPPPLRTLWNAQDRPTLPWLVVNYPRYMQTDRSVWAGRLNAKAVAAVLDSPARRDIARKLLGGESAVWLLLESGDKRHDDALAQLIEAKSRELEQTLILPEPSPFDPQINPDLPLKVAFSTVRVSRSNPAERLFINQLLNWDPELVSSTKAMFFPIFGRGRVVPPAIGDEIQAEAIQAIAEFLTGACSCEVKELNPGHDLLLTADWDSLISYGETMVPDLPLVSLSQFAAPPSAGDGAAAAAPLPISSAADDAAPTTAEHGLLGRNLIIVVGIGVFFLATATISLRGRANRNSR